MDFEPCISFIELINVYTEECCLADTVYMIPYIH